MWQQRDSNPQQLSSSTNTQPQFGYMTECSFKNYVIVGSNPVAVTLVSSKEFPDIQVSTECRFTLKRARDMIITYSQLKKQLITSKISLPKKQFQEKSQYRNINAIKILQTKLWILLMLQGYCVVRKLLTVVLILLNKMHSLGIQV